METLFIVCIVLVSLACISGLIIGFYEEMKVIDEQLDSLRHNRKGE
jgi:uncharacterized protein YneF (UPF0154 family)